VLDLSQVQFIDSTALGVLAGAHQSAQAGGGDLRLVVDDPFLLKIFHITGFDGIFAIFSQVEAALAGV
jgi:anti-sigma B factor antagonist